MGTKEEWLYLKTKQNSSVGSRLMSGFERFRIPFSPPPEKLEAAGGPCDAGAFVGSCDSEVCKIFPSPKDEERTEKKKKLDRQQRGTQNSMEQSGLCSDSCCRWTNIELDVCIVLKRGKRQEGWGGRITESFIILFIVLNVRTLGERRDPSRYRRSMELLVCTSSKAFRSHGGGGQTAPLQLFAVV